MPNLQNNYARAMTGMREVEFKTFYMVGILVGFYIYVSCSDPPNELP